MGIYVKCSRAHVEAREGYSNDPVLLWVVKVFLSLSGCIRFLFYERERRKRELSIEGERKGNVGLVSEHHACICRDLRVYLSVYIYIHIYLSIYRWVWVEIKVERLKENLLHSSHRIASVVYW